MKKKLFLCPRKGTKLELHVESPEIPGSWGETISGGVIFPDPRHLYKPLVWGIPFRCKEAENQILGIVSYKN